MNLIDFNRPKKCQIAIDDQELVSVDFSSQKGSFDDVQLEFIKSEFGYDLLVKSERKKISHIYLTYDLSIGDILVFCRTGAYSCMEGMSIFLSRDLPSIALYSKKTGLEIIRKPFLTDVFNTPICYQNK